VGKCSLFFFAEFLKDWKDRKKIDRSNKT